MNKSNHPDRRNASTRFDTLRRACFLVGVILIGAVFECRAQEPSRVRPEASAEAPLSGEMSLTQTAAQAVLGGRHHGSARYGATKDAATPRVAPACTAPRLTYFNGPLLANVQIVPVFWSSAVNAEVITEMPQFYADASVSSWFNLLLEYSAVDGLSGTNQSIGWGTAVGGITLTPSICPGTGTCSMTDPQLQAELERQINMGVLPQPQSDPSGYDRTLYMVHFPPNVTLSFPSGGTSCENFCSYHNTGTYNGGALPYGAIMDTFTSACASGCGTNSTALENQTDIASYELAQAVTDPDIGLDTGASYQYPAGWADNNNLCGEIADICDSGGPGDAITVSGRTWVVQELWSNAQGQCTSATPFNPTLNLSLPGNVTSGTAFNLTLTAQNPFGNGGVDNAYIGTVHFTSSDPSATLPGDFTFGPDSLGTASLAATLQSTGSQSITATTTVGTAPGAVSSSTTVQAGQPQSQTISFSIPAPVSATYGTGFAVAASATSGLAVVFSAAGSCTNQGTAYTMTSGAGSCSVIANQPGNGAYSAAPQVTEVVAAAQAGQTISVTTPAPGTATNGSGFTVVASASSGLPISFGSSGACTNSGANYTITAASGVCTATLNQGGNTNFLPANTVTESTNVLQGTLTVSASNLSFGNVLVNSLHKLSVTLTNSSASAAAVGDIDIVPGTADASAYSYARTCGASLKPGKTCTITVELYADAIGAQTATLNIGGGLYSVGLTGTVTGLKLAPSQLNFAVPISVGRSGAVKVLTLSNLSSDSSISVTGISIGGSNPGDFEQENTCGSALAPGAECFVDVVFKPTATGPRTATLDIADSDPSSPQTINMTGTGK